MKHITDMQLQRYKLFEWEQTICRYIDQNETFKLLDNEDQRLMTEQYQHLNAARLVLEQRLRNAEQKAASDIIKPPMRRES